MASGEWWWWRWRDYWSNRPLWIYWSSGCNRPNWPTRCNGAIWRTAGTTRRDWCHGANWASRCNWFARRNRGGRCCWYRWCARYQCVFYYTRIYATSSWRSNIGSSAIWLLDTVRAIRLHTVRRLLHGCNGLSSNNGTAKPRLFWCEYSCWIICFFCIIISRRNSWGYWPSWWRNW